MDDRIDELEEKRAEAEPGGGEDRIESQHEKGKKTAREPIDYFLDHRPVHEFGRVPTHRPHKF